MCFYRTGVLHVRSFEKLLSLLEVDKGAMSVMMTVALLVGWVLALEVEWVAVPPSWAGWTG
jgi:hypothetical protein